MGTLFYYPAIIHHQYGVKTKAKNPVGDNDSRFVLQVVIQVANDLLFGTGVYGTQAIRRAP